MLSVPRAQTTGEMQDLMVVVMMVEGMATVLSSDLTQCLGGRGRPSLGGVLLWQQTKASGKRAVTSLG